MSVDHFYKWHGSLDVEVILVALLLGPMKGIFIDVLLVCYEPCVFGSPGRV